MRKALFIGRITRDVQLSKTKSDKSLVNFSIAVNEKYEGKDITNFFDCVIWGKSAENFASLCEKGTQLYIEALPEIQSWEKDDQKISKVVFNTQKFEILSGYKKKDESAPQKNEPDIPNDDIPF